MEVRYQTAAGLRGFSSAPGVVYIQKAVFYSSLHIHHQIVNTSHFPIFSRPKLGGGINVTIRVRNKRFELKLGPNRGVSGQITLR